MKQNSTKCTQNLHMSAKSSTFAAENDEDMEITEMRHTCWRCRNGYYCDKKLPLQCKAGVTLQTQADEELCKHFLPSETAEAFFAGQLKGSHANTLANIYLERQRKGTF